MSSALTSALEMAVPLWCEKLRSLSPEELAERASVCGRHIAASGDMLLFKVPGKTAEAFNRTAEGLACLVLLVGQVKFGGVVFKDWLRPEPPADPGQDVLDWFDAMPTVRKP